jgi:dihydrofolate synthase/folylpolyglutamate synthase
MSSRVDSSARRDAALRFLTGRIDYERTQSMPCSEEAMKLDRMRELLGRLGNPHEAVPTVHVAGTKGKGSTSAMIAAVLSAAGYRTGLFTSPHLDRVEERIAIDGRPCSADELADLVERVRPAVEAMDQAAASPLPLGEGPGVRADQGSGVRDQGLGVRGQGSETANPEISDLQSPNFPISKSPNQHGPTYFEIVTAMAFEHFRRRGVDAAVLEVGLGGRLDSTNVCSPCVTIITSISFDHTRQLGDTLASIAAEKAGIIKPGVPVISGVVAEEPRETIRRIAGQNGCRLIELGVDFRFDYHPPRHLERAASPARFDFQYGKPRPSVAEPTATTGRGFTAIELSLVGRHQAANAAVALAALEELRQSGWRIPEAAIRRGLAEVAWPARVEVVARRPTIVLDAAHNVASIAALVEVLGESFSAARRLLIFATTQEKEHRGMLQQLLGRFDHVIFTRYSDNPRSVPPAELLELAKSIGRGSSSTNGWGGSSTAAPATTSRLPLGEGPGVRAATMEIAATPADAWAAARRMATPDDLICITGSFFLASEMRTHVAAQPFGWQQHCAVNSNKR